MDRVAAAAELAKLAEQAGKPELAKIAVEFGLESSTQTALHAANPAHGMWLNLSQSQLHKEDSSDSTDDFDALNSARTWEQYELDPSNITIDQEAGGVETVNLLPVTPGLSRTAKRRFRRQRVRQKLRLLEQFPQLTPRELQYHQRIKLLEEW